LELKSCSVIQNIDSLNTTQLTKLGANPNDLTECTLIYPSRAYIIVIDSDQRSKTGYIEVPDSGYDDWLWYVILAAVVVLAVASYFIYIWWRNKKMIQAHSVQDDDMDEMEAVIEEQEMGGSEAENDDVETTHFLVQ